MPWKECHAVDERLRVIARLLDGERMAQFCEEFGVSRKTGHKIFDRYRDAGLIGLTDRSRHPHRHANRTGRWTCRGSVLTCVQKGLSQTGGHGKRLIVEVDLTDKESGHDHPCQA